MLWLYPSNYKRTEASLIASNYCVETLIFILRMWENLILYVCDDAMMMKVKVIEES